MSKYIIYKGCHFSTFVPKLIGCKQEDFAINKTVLFEDNCKYSIDEPSCVNKLYGVSFGLFNVHKQSVRFGWSYDGDKDAIQLWSYIYKDNVKKVHKNKLCYIPINRQVSCGIEFMCTDDGKYIVSFVVDGVLQYQEVLSFTGKPRLTLGPYFGGNTKAPHKMAIQLTNN